MATAVGSSALLAYDTATHQRFLRNSRTAALMVSIAYDYKVRRLYPISTSDIDIESQLQLYQSIEISRRQIWLSKHPNELDTVHERVARRLVNVCKKNGGLYVKMGQGISTMNHVLPPQYTEAFSDLRVRRSSRSTSRR